MAIAYGGFDAGMAEQGTDHRQAEAFVDEQAGEGMPKIVLPEILEAGALADRGPRLFRTAFDIARLAGRCRPGKRKGPRRSSRQSAWRSIECRRAVAATTMDLSLASVVEAGLRPRAGGEIELLPPRTRELRFF